MCERESEQERVRERERQTDRQRERERERERPRMALRAKSLVSSILSIRTVDLNSLLLLSPTTLVSCRRLNLHSSPCIVIHQDIYMYTHVYMHIHTCIQLHHVTSTRQERGCRAMPERQEATDNLHHVPEFALSKFTLLIEVLALPQHPQFSRSAYNVSSRASGSSHELVQVRDRMCPL